MRFRPNGRSYCGYALQSGEGIQFQNNLTVRHPTAEGEIVECMAVLFSREAERRLALRNLGHVATSVFRASNLVIGSLHGTPVL